MARFVVGDDRSQSTLFPERLDEYLARTILSGRSMSLSMSLIWPNSALTVSSRRRREGRPIILRRC